MIKGWIKLVEFSVFNGDGHGIIAHPLKLIIKVSKASLRLVVTIGLRIMSLVVHKDDGGGVLGGNNLWISLYSRLDSRYLVESRCWLLMILLMQLGMTGYINEYIGILRGRSNNLWRWDSNVRRNKGNLRGWNRCWNWQGHRCLSKICARKLHSRLLICRWRGIDNGGRGKSSSDEWRHGDSGNNNTVSLKLLAESQS